VPPALGDLASKGLSAYGVVQRVLKPNRQVGANHRDESTVTDESERARHVSWCQRVFFSREGASHSLSNMAASCARLFSSHCTVMVKPT